ncbi:FAD binding domain-containing protein [Alicyclobacillus sp.]|uniref:FAD binding domain-containing protein n=1 Tax=Alicyclobacillus sp. TaxID=61169 RepID=UPI0025B7E77E|nr:FAD binding domain-containing protein [Alicyclobacillus sp.]MCL6516858.1 FAD binding domain-containing protein [Alicyclobacillus sp.]
MKPVAFSYHRPRTLDEALALLRSEPDCKVIAGGQSLIPLMNFRLSRPGALVDINEIEGLNRVEKTDGGLRIGALVRHQALAEHPLVREVCPVLAEAAGHVGHWAIRNRGSLGGSLAHADPAAELPAAMVALDARFEVASADGVRQVPARSFFLGYLMTDLAPDELLVAVHVPAQTGRAFGFHEFARRPGDFALAGAFAEVGPGGAGAVTWFGVSGGPERCELTFPEDAAAREAAFAALVEPFDPGQDAPYRRHLAVQAAERAYQQAVGGRG